VVWELSDVNTGSGLPLEGVRVLDFSRVLAGPLAAMIAGDLGADVIKVEGPDGDPVRALAPPYFGEDATYYLAVNRHRRNVVADLRNPDDFAAIETLVREADAVVENYLPSQYAQLGIERLRRANPECVWVSVTPAASGSDLSMLPSFDALAQARSGLMGVTGEASGAPTKVGAPLADVITGLYGAIALVTGLYARLAGRPGRHFEAPLLESTMSALINQAQGYLATGVNPRRLGNDHPSIAPYGPLRTSDGLVMLAVGTDAQFARLLESLDDQVLLASRDFERNDQRVARRDDLRESLERVFVTRTTDEWLKVLSEVGVPHAPILDVAGAFAQETIAAGDFVDEMSTPYGLVHTMRSPLRIDGVRPRVRSGPRRLGQDTAELLGQKDRHS
jgi:crotonobetainyl-CoA:carnitine CoA-transferase CaiB-like acyl-CoA transferase